MGIYLVLGDSISIDNYTGVDGGGPRSSSSDSASDTRARDVLEPITEDDFGVVCWLAVLLPS
jgi:hypothetical protein